MPASPVAIDLSALNALPSLPTSAPLADKLARAREVCAAVRDATGGHGVAVAFTGGKDSSIVLSLWLALLRGTPGDQAFPANPPAETLPLAISIDTGLKFPQVTALRDRLCAEWGARLVLARPDVDLAAYPVARDKLSCCRDLKIRPLGRTLRAQHAGVLLCGLRRDEAPSRAARPYAEWREETEDTPAHWQVNPILDWTEMDVWAHITGEGLPFCELYQEGYRSLGCMPCTKPTGADEDERAGRDQEKERQLDVLKGLGYF